MNYQDSVIIVDPVVDEYGNDKIGRQETVRAIVGHATDFTQGATQASVESDAIAYLDPANPFVMEKYNRLEGMLVITGLGEATADAWYRIIEVNVGRRSLLNNALDNVQVGLKKSTAISGVS